MLDPVIDSQHACASAAGNCPLVVGVQSSQGTFKSWYVRSQVIVSCLMSHSIIQFCRRDLLVAVPTALVPCHLKGILACILLLNFGHCLACVVLNHFLHLISILAVCKHGIHVAVPAMVASSLASLQRLPQSPSLVHLILDLQVVPHLHLAPSTVSQDLPCGFHPVRIILRRTHAADPRLLVYEWEQAHQ